MSSSRFVLSKSPFVMCKSGFVMSRSRWLHQTPEDHTYHERMVAYRAVLEYYCETREYVNAILYMYIPLASILAIVSGDVTSVYVIPMV